MKIGNPADKHVTLPVISSHDPALESAKPGTAASVQPSAADPSAKVELSSTASTLLASGPGEFDAEKVARIADAIGNGTFKVNPEAIADKLIANAQELLGKAGR